MKKKHKMSPETEYQIKQMVEKTCLYIGKEIKDTYNPKVDLKCIDISYFVIAQIEIGGYDKESTYKDLETAYNREEEKIIVERVKEIVDSHFECKEKKEFALRIPFSEIYRLSNL